MNTLTKSSVAKLIFFDDCKRKQFKASWGQKSSDDMLPDGGTMHNINIVLIFRNMLIAKRYR